MRTWIIILCSVLFACGGGGSSSPEIDLRIGDWFGPQRQSGCIACAAGAPICAGAGAVIAQAFISIRSENGQFIILDGECEYFALETTATSIFATSNDTSCNREVTFALLADNQAEYTTSPRPAEAVNECVVATIGSLERDQPIGLL